MKPDTNHQVTLTTNECAALLSAAKCILDQYEDTGRDGGEHSESLQTAVGKITAGMGLSPEKAAALLHFMATGRHPDMSWRRINID